MLWLVGMMGSGKSSVGAAVAARTECDFIDMDDLLEARWGPIWEQWRRDGESVFREREADLVAELATKQGERVVSTGGGAVLVPASVALMRASGTVVWLRAGLGTLRVRLADGPERPPAAGADVGRILEERTAAYRSSAHHTVDTDELDVSGVVEQVVSVWK
jgi:shikimate kinase